MKFYLNEDVNDFNNEGRSFHEKVEIKIANDKQRNLFNRKGSSLLLFSGILLAFIFVALLCYQALTKNYSTEVNVPFTMVIIVIFRKYGRIKERNYGIR